MIVREIEVCPVCGQWNPWRKVSSRIVKGRRRIYCVCARCGRKETIEYRAREDLRPNGAQF